jgi:hypothetical protein
MVAPKKRCSCRFSDVEIVSLTPAQPRWGHAALFDADSDVPELTVTTVAAWALVRRDTDGCTCPSSLVVPMTYCGQVLQPEVPNADLFGPIQFRLIEPGLRPVARRAETNGHYYLDTVRGTWEPGLQEIEAASDTSGSGPRPKGERVFVDAEACG